MTKIIRITEFSAKKLAVDLNLDNSVLKEAARDFKKGKTESTQKQAKRGRLLLVALPGYSPDFNADEEVWDWAREEVTANLCLGTKAKVREKVGSFFSGLCKHTAEVKQRCRTVSKLKQTNYRN